MAAKRKTKHDPDEVVHIQAKAGGDLRFDGFVYGHRATVQVRRSDLERVEGDWEEVDPAALPDAAAR